MQRKTALLISLAGALVFSFGAWHVLSYRSSVADLEQEISAVQVPASPEQLQSADLAGFLGAVNTIFQGAPRLTALEDRRRRLVGESTWLQRVFTTDPDSTRAIQVNGSMRTTLAVLPSLVLVQSHHLTDALRAKALARSPELRQEAVAFKAGRVALGAAAGTIDGMTINLLKEPPGATAAFEGDSTAKRFEAWIDRSAMAEKKALAQAEQAMTQAAHATQTTNQLQQDAPSSQIASAVAAWNEASRTAHSALAVLDYPSPPRDFEALYDGLTAPARGKVDGVVAEIDANLGTIQHAYNVAVNEEASLLGGLMRFGRRASRSVKQFLASTGDALERRSAELSASISAGIDQAVIASADLLAKGHNMYEDSRKPPAARFLASSEGMTFIGVAVGLLLICGVVGAVTRSS